MRKIASSDGLEIIYEIDAQGAAPAQLLTACCRCGAPAGDEIFIAADDPPGLNATGQVWEFSG